jgi:hypothetical protein
MLIIDEINVGLEVINEVRLPLEEQPRTKSQSDDEDSSESSQDEADGNSSPVRRTELAQHLSTITAVMADLYKLSFKIRSPSSRSMAVKAMLYKEVDKETGVDLFSVYSESDRRHVEESLKELRKDRASPQLEGQRDYQFLVDRLSKAVTNRRRYFRYWRRHATKLATMVGDSVVEQKQLIPPISGFKSTGLVERNR